MDMGHCGRGRVRAFVDALFLFVNKPFDIWASGYQEVLVESSWSGKGYIAWNHMIDEEMFEETQYLVDVGFYGGKSLNVPSPLHPLAGCDN
ncbi:hypothetical protein WAI453_008354 [Rhynchosporium graminicola]